VETFAAAVRILAEGPQWFVGLGTETSTGTRLVSVAGDCARPGVHEIVWGTTLRDLLHRVGADDAAAVQVSGPAGELVDARAAADRRIGYEDLSCNGAVTVFDGTRDVLEVVREHLRFFVGESCGICSPCRIGTTELLHAVERAVAGRATAEDLAALPPLSDLIAATSRCGLGHTAPNPVLSLLRSFPGELTRRVAGPADGLLPRFDLDAAVGGYAPLVARLEQEA
jgi:[NiFe] hydrogenase diaphorase moiety large subunit